MRTTPFKFTKNLIAAVLNTESASSATVHRVDLAKAAHKIACHKFGEAAVGDWGRYYHQCITKAGRKQNQTNDSGLDQFFNTIIDKFGSLKSFCDDYQADGVDYVVLSKIRAHTLPVFDRCGLINSVVLNACDFLDLSPEELFGTQPLHPALSTPEEFDDTTLRSVLMRERSEAIDETLKSLSPRVARILRMRFGVGITTDYSHREIGNVYGVTSGRVMQIEDGAPRRLKRSMQGDLLREFTNFEDGINWVFSRPVLNSKEAVEQEQARMAAEKAEQEAAIAEIKAMEAILAAKTAQRDADLMYGPREDSHTNGEIKVIASRFM
jgi:hypothetical protein